MRLSAVRHLTAGYLSVLALIIVLMIGEHVALERFIAIKSANGELINITGRQRMLSQRIAMFALLANSGDRSAVADMRRATQRFHAEHVWLMTQVQQRRRDGTGTVALADAYFGKGRVDRLSMRLLSLAQDIIDQPQRSSARSSLDDRKGAARLDALVSLARGPLLRQLEYVVSLRQRESEQLVAMLQTAHWTILIIIVTIQIVAVLIILVPLSRHVGLTLHTQRRLADQDFLTGLSSRRAFVGLSERQIAQSHRRGKPMALCIVDVDHFKAVNDVHGHAVGDRVLIAVSAVLRASSHAGAIVGRLGGEEFAIVLTDVSIAQATAIADNVRAAVAIRTGDPGTCPAPVTVSIGVAAIAPTAEGALEAALAAADQMLYRAKQSGRNCVWPRETPLPPAPVAPSMIVVPLLAAA